MLRLFFSVSICYSPSYNSWGGTNLPFLKVIFEKCWTFDSNYVGGSVRSRNEKKLRVSRFLFGS